MKNISRKRIFSARVEELNLSVRSSNCLRYSGVNTIGDLTERKASDLLRIRHFGKKSLAEVIERLQEYGLHLKQKADTKPENVVLNKSQSLSLFRTVEELSLSVRSHNCLKGLNLVYIGDLVQKRGSELLEEKNFGRKSLSEIQEKLNILNLHLGVKIKDWTPERIDYLLKKYRKDLDRIKREEAERNKMYLEGEINSLEDELYFISALAGQKRNTEIIRRHYGWDGLGVRTLQAVADEYQMTRERVRQICQKFESKIKWRKYRKLIFVPLLESSLKCIVANIPNRADEIENELSRNRFSKGKFRIEGLLSACKLLGIKTSFSIIKLKGERIIVASKDRWLPKMTIQLAKKAISHRGVSTVSEICAQIEAETRRPIDKDFAISILALLEDFTWLDKDNGWFWLSSVPRNRLLNLIRKILCVSEEIDIAELRSGIGRNHRMEGFSPPGRVLSEICNQVSWCKVENTRVIADPPLNWEEILDRSTTEWAIAAVFKEYGPIMSREDLEEKCLELGMNENTFFQYLSYSPIITKYSIGVYGLRGARGQPGEIESLKRKRERKKVLVDYGWTEDSKIWLIHRVSNALIKSGVTSIPTAMKPFLKGDFQLKTADNAFIGNMRVRDCSAWSLSPFFQRRGGEVGDYLAIKFDVTSREAVIFIGDEDLIDVFRPEY